MAYDKILKCRIEQIWYRNRKSSIREIRLICLNDPEIGIDCPSTDTISNWINNAFKPKHHPLETEKGDVIDSWSEVTFRAFDQDRITTLIILADVLGLVMDSLSQKKFEGFTKRQADWACKLQAFFNIANQFEAKVLLLFTFQFSKQERFELEISKPTAIDRSDPLSQALMAWVWWDPSSETSRADRFYPWEYGEEHVNRMVAIASGLLREPIDITSTPDEPIRCPFTDF